jgi:hypothetical protein
MTGPMKLDMLTLPSPDMNRLDSMGATYNYPDGVNYEEPTPLEMAARQYMLDIIDREMGPSKDRFDELTKSSIIRECIGDNRNASAVTRALGLFKPESAVEFLRSGKEKELIRRARNK